MNLQYNLVWDTLRVTILLFIYASAVAQGIREQKGNWAVKPSLPISKQKSIDVSSTENSESRAIKRAALVVAAADYEEASGLNKLNNPVHDGRAMAQKLRTLGFKVDTLFNPSMEELNASMDLWQETLEHSREGLFYFAGHGLNYDDQSYIIPVSRKGRYIDLTSRSQVENNCKSVQQILNTMEDAGLPVQLLIIDACRDYKVRPNVKDFGKTTYRGNELHSIGMLYAAGAGNKAFDGQPGTNGVFTGSVLKHIALPGESFNDLVSGVTKEVANLTENKQVPRDMQNSVSDFYFSPPGNNKGDSTALSFAEMQQRSTTKATELPQKPQSVSESVWNKKKKLLEKGASFAAGSSYANAMACFLKAASMDPAAGNFEIGTMFQYGNSTTPDPAKALMFYKKAADAGHAPSLYRIGMLFEKSKYGMQNYPNAIKYYRLAAAKKYTKAENNLGNMYLEGNGFKKSAASAANCFLSSAKTGDPEGMLLYSIMCREGKGIAADAKTADKWYNKAVAAADPECMLKFGLMYQNGTGIKQNFTEAINWYKKAAEAGNTAALVNLGCMYSGEQGVTANYVQAFNYYQKAADAGRSEGMFNIGLMHENGKGGPVNLREAAAWYRQAAPLNDPEAMYSLGYLYYSGNGVPLNYPEALEWFLKAADLNYTPAMVNIGYMYFSGTGVSQSAVEAESWFVKAAELYNTEAMVNLANIKERVYRSVAIKWLTKAADAGDTTAMTNLADLIISSDIPEALKRYKTATDLNCLQATRNLAYLYTEAKYTPLNLPEAERLLNLLADRGMTEALTDLFTFYTTTPNYENYPKAISNLQKSAERNNIFGQNNLAELYLRGGYGLTTDTAKAKYWYLKAYSNGSILAQLPLGELYYKAKEYGTAKKYLSEAAASDYSAANVLLGRMCLNGEGQSKDIKEAVANFKKAADRQDPEGLYYWGYLSETGTGVAKNHNTALQFYTQASKLGNKAAQMRLKKLQGKS